MTARKCHYVILQAADEEIEHQVAYYTERASPEVAVRFYGAVKAAIVGLLKMPKKGRVHKSRLPQLAGIRVWFVQEFPFLVYYRILDDCIEVVHVLHGAQDRDAILK